MAYKIIQANFILAAIKYLCFSGPLRSSKNKTKQSFPHPMKPPPTLPNLSKNTPSTVYKTCTITGKHHIPSSTLSTPFWLPPAPTISRKTNSKAFKISTLRHMSKNKKSSTKENSLSKIKSRERSKNSLPIFSKGQISLTVYQLT